MKSFKRIFSFVLFFIIIAAPNLYSQNESDTIPAGMKPLRTAFLASQFSEVDLKDAQVAIQVWIEQFNKEANAKYSTRIFIFDDAAALMKAARAKEIDMFTVSTLDFLKYRDELSLEFVTVPLIGAEVLDEYILLVNAKSKVKNLRDLARKQLIIHAGNKGDISLLWLSTLLLKEGLPEASDFFSLVKRADNSSNAILPVFFNQADACVVTKNAFETVTELNPQVSKELVALLASPGLLADMSTYRTDFPEEDKISINKSALELMRKPYGRQILMLFRRDGMTTFKPEYLSNIESLYREYNDLKAGRQLVK